MAFYFIRDFAWTKTAQDSDIRQSSEKDKKLGMHVRERVQVCFQEDLYFFFGQKDWNLQYEANKFLSDRIYTPHESLLRTLQSYHRRCPHPCNPDTEGHEPGKRNFHKLK